MEEVSQVLDAVVGQVPVEVAPGELLLDVPARLQGLRRGKLSQQTFTTGSTGWKGCTHKLGQIRVLWPITQDTPWASTSPIFWGGKLPLGRHFNDNSTSPDYTKCVIFYKPVRITKAESCTQVLTETHVVQKVSFNLYTSKCGIDPHH